MNITIEIPIESNFLPVQIKELQKELTLHAKIWMDKFAKKKDVKDNELFRMPEEFEALCGSISEDEVENSRANDPMLDALMDKYK